MTVNPNDSQSSAAIANAMGWYETILQHLRDLNDPQLEDVTREAIQESPLSVDVCSGWQPVGSRLSPERFQILLSTGGPALRIVGDLDAYGSPTSSRLECQDWGTTWTECNFADPAILDAWAAEFYFVG